MSSPNPETAPELISLASLGAVLRRRWLLLVAGALLGLLVGLLLSQLMPTRYHAVGTVKVGAGVVQAADMSGQTLGAVTEAEVATLQPQLDEIAGRLGVSPETVKGSLAVANRTGTSLIDFTYAGSSPAEAEQGAQAAVDVYLDVARQNAEKRLHSRTATLRAQLASARDPGVRGDIVSQLRDLRVSVVDYGSVMRTPAGSAEETLMRPELYVPATATAGLILAGLFALLLEAARPRVRIGVPLRGIPLLGGVTGSENPVEGVRRSLLASKVAVGRGRLAVVPVGLPVDVAASVVTQALPGTRTLDLSNRDSLRLAKRVSAVVLLVRDGSPVKMVEEVLAPLATLGVAVQGMVTAPRRLVLATTSTQVVAEEDDRVVDDNRNAEDVKRSVSRSAAPFREAEV